MTGRTPAAGGALPGEQPEAPAKTLAAAWGGRSHQVDLDGPVHWVDFGGLDQADRPPLVLVHGLGGSHLDWVATARALALHTRVVAVDLAGFGLTPTAGRSASVRANAELLHRFLEAELGRPAVLVGNSMGGMISLLQAEAHPGAVAGLVLVDPSLPQKTSMQDREVAIGFVIGVLPVVGAWVARRVSTSTPTRVAVQRVLALCFADPSRADPTVVDAMVALAEHRRRLAPEDRAFRTAARSLIRVTSRPARYLALMRRVGVPVLLVHGSEDRLVARAAADAVAAALPAWQYVVLDGVGHTPQLETPERLVSTVAAWLEESGLAPALDTEVPH